ncbi:EamA family transporter [Allokutzneria sp. NRRL B-24872]|uniref:EamA family transporter n=1 Tax=Allokutzneria sp. NRRL B-24872 TaxID=1137961 RepID=UPI001FEECCC1|nr:EamA family transporter [Allokutzneria sp. NRRL B-24872]
MSAMKPKHVALALLVAAVWGVNFVVMEIGLGEFPPLLFSALRFLAAAIPAVLFIGRPRVAWRWVIAVGLVLGVANFGLLFIGMKAGMTAGLSSLVVQSQALFTALFAALLLRERPGRRRLTGMAIAFTGIALVTVEYGASSPLTAFLLVIGAAACWGLSNVITRHAKPPDTFRFMVWVSVVPIVPMLGLSWLVEGPSAGLAALSSLTVSGVGATLYVAWAATLLGFGIWGYLLREYDATAVAPFTLLVPLFGMSSAALLLGEELTPLRCAAAVLVIAGVAITSLPPLSRRRRRQSSAPASAYAPMPIAQSLAGAVNSSTNGARQ